MHCTSSIRLTHLNAYLQCALCGGYLIDPATLTECLHSFCKTCIVGFLGNNNCCPICMTMVHKTKPLQNLKMDRTMQDLVYKLVPGLFRNEMRRRREFYAENSATDNTEAQHPTDSFDRGEVDTSELPYIYTIDDKISLCLQFSPNGKPVSEETKASSTRDVHHIRQRFLLCPAVFTIGHLKKFLRMKLNFKENHEIIVFHSDEALSDEYSLMDVAYVYNWRRRKPLDLYFSVCKAIQKSPKTPPTNKTKTPESAKSKPPKAAPNPNKISIPPSPVHGPASPKKRKILPKLPAATNQTSSISLRCGLIPGIQPITPANNVQQSIAGPSTSGPTTGIFSPSTSSSIGLPVAAVDSSNGSAAPHVFIVTKAASGTSANPPQSTAVYPPPSELTTPQRVSPLFLKPKLISVSSGAKKRKRKSLTNEKVSLKKSALFEKIPGTVKSDSERNQMELVSRTRSANTTSSLDTKSEIKPMSVSALLKPGPPSISTNTDPPKSIITAPGIVQDSEETRLKEPKTFSIPFLSTTSEKTHDSVELSLATHKDVDNAEVVKLDTQSHPRSPPVVTESSVSAVSSAMSSITISSGNNTLSMELPISKAEFHNFRLGATRSVGSDDSPTSDTPESQSSPTNLTTDRSGDHNSASFGFDTCDVMDLSVPGVRRITAIEVTDDNSMTDSCCSDSNLVIDESCS